MSQVQIEAQQVLGQLIENGDSNQFIIVLGISEVARQQLDNDKECLGAIEFRFMSITEEINFKLRARMGIPRADIMFGNTTTHKSIDNTEKQPDDCFWPPPRQQQGRTSRVQGWPTLVIETGVSESLSRLREDARWCTSSAPGHRGKWHMQEPGRGSEPSAFGFAACHASAALAQEIVITSTSVEGAPLTIGFEALFDRLPRGSETDIVLDALDLRHCARVV
ncbi:uncharacterized protein KD926_005061 [Aspergillus affinis]|uniref:uncharacterized protein n=1 Tax=Aspergillus affinis TaxID=1070780 RepID=UPI0022FE261C|nr:uncharacterized protein KD926_005061 [Aspergillus affinis]KAI9042731.1 hypothetical protein KD926_005061 [Aspergillus affinis]